MKDVKRRIEFFSVYDRDSIAAHLEAMAARGWQLERITSSFWYYQSRAAAAALRRDL